MGSGASVNEVADHVCGMGAAYATYREAIVDNGLTAQVIVELNEEEVVG
jgi:hypothetical protein